MRTCTYLDHRRQERCTECGEQVNVCRCADHDLMAQRRHTTDEGQFLKFVLGSALLDSPAPDHLYERLVSEIGMLGMMLVENDLSRTPPPEDIKHKLVKIATTVVLLATRGTSEYAYPAG